ncbi:MAG: biopolymer transporter ExbD [Lentisphaeria bacterium]|nr:biopolymer transporter ExbD [Lentisphaeria bacterium]
MYTIRSSFSGDTSNVPDKVIRPALKAASPFPELIPFVNVFFLLLIFFVMGSSFVSVSAIPVTLPRTANAGIYSVKKYIITVDDKGTIYFNDVIIENMDTLKTRLLSDVRGISDGTGSIVLRADLRTNFGTIAKIMALADELNINTFILAGKNEEEKKTSFRDE